jgi:hypothetical protein
MSVIPDSFKLVAGGYFARTRGGGRRFDLTKRDQGLGRQTPVFSYMTGKAIFSA